jgi:hypothetical protein
MDAMLRTLVLLATHMTMLLAGAGLALITVRAHRQAVDAREAALSVRELFLTETIERREHRVRNETAQQPADYRGRHHIQPRGRARNIDPLTRIQPAARPKRQPSLLTASLSEATAIIATQKAQRVQERRQFVDLMTSLVGPARVRKHVEGHARVA